MVALILLGKLLQVAQAILAMPASLSILIQLQVQHLTRILA